VPDRRYIPRSFFLNDIDFGLVDVELRWKPTSAWTPGSTEDQARASWIQHCIAQAYGTRREFAAAAGVDYERLGRVLRGEYVMRLEEIGLAERVFGVGVRLTTGSIAPHRDA
jgi:hypothetical protein